MAYYTWLTKYRSNTDLQKYYDCLYNLTRQ